MANLVTSVAGIKRNIRTLARYAHGTEQEKRFHAGRIKNGKVFVVLKTNRGLLFAPSKFAGYKNNNLGHRLDLKNRDGGVTNRRISMLVSKYVDQSSKGYAAIDKAYLTYCRKFRIRPSIGERPRRYWIIDEGVGSRARSSTHILQGGVTNGDKRWLERAAVDGLRWPSWIAPKTVAPDDQAIIYIRGYGFFATARIASAAKKRDDWFNRYGAALKEIELIAPPISRGVIQKRVPDLTWAAYPRSITTVSKSLSRQLRRLIDERRSEGVGDVAKVPIDLVGYEELRALAFACARKSLPPKVREIKQRKGSAIIHRYVLSRAKGTCEGCDCDAPFFRVDFSPYLEPHHTLRRADDGPDHPATVIALCPNCHRRAHHSVDHVRYNVALKRKLKRIEPETAP